MLHLIGETKSRLIDAKMKIKSGLLPQSLDMRTNGGEVSFGFCF